MSAVIEAPTELLEACAAMRFPPPTDALLQSLMDRNTDGALNAEERAELQALVELSESISLIRAKALRVLGRAPA
ncbi:MAG: hypothetical protein U0791_02355 [Gemmataceae bacterium]